MEKKELTVKEMLVAILTSDWEGKGEVNENSSADAIRQAYYRMIHDLEVKASKGIDQLIYGA